MANLQDFYGDGFLIVPVYLDGAIHHVRVGIDDGEYHCECDSTISTLVRSDNCIVAEELIRSA